jgi:N-acetylglutamate synthase-like GNAT family acetyltransferase
MESPATAAAISIRPLREADLDDADRIFRLAFGTYLGLPDPMAFMTGAELVRARWRTAPHAFLAAEVDGALAGSNYATNWGSVGLFGPLTIRPDLWDRGIGQRLLEATMACFESWQTRDVGLFTFPHSPKHIALYQKFGFWPRSLTCVMRKQVTPRDGGTRAALVSQLPEDARRDVIEACFALSDSVHAGLDVRDEITAVLTQNIGDTLLLWDGSRLAAFAVCHCGPGAEAETGTCYVKFGLCRSGAQARATFDSLLDECERFAAARSAGWLVAGTNTARDGAYRAMLAGGFAPLMFGIAMHRPNEPMYNRADAWVIDDWR